MQLEEGRRPEAFRGEGSGCILIRAEFSPGCSSVFCLSLTGFALVKNLPTALLLALCPEAVGGVPVSLVGRPDRHAPPFQPSLPHHSLADRCIVLGRGGSWTVPQPHAPSLQPKPGAQRSGPPCTARRVSSGGMNVAACPHRGLLYLLP